MPEEHPIRKGLQNMNPSIRNPLLHSKPHPSNLTAAATRQLLNPARGNPAAPRDVVEGCPVVGVEASGTVSIAGRSLEPCSDRARDKTEARVATKRQPSLWVRKEDLSEFIKAGAIIGATILGLRLYAAMASPSPW